MSRWEPDARGRLLRAAVELYTERGFDETTVAEIAGRAGLTERTFFRHFADKREVLFSGQGRLAELVVAAVAGAPEGASPMDAVAAGLEATGAMFTAELRDGSRHRQQVIDAHPELGERERAKLAGMARSIAGTLRERGVADRAAELAAEAGVVVFRIAFERWLTEDRDLADLVRESLRDLRSVTAG
jgi:AcrR family transcriptional regulator